MIAVWLSALVLAAVAYLLMWRRFTRAMLLLVAAVLAKPFVLILWIIVLGDRMPEGAILVEPAPEAVP